MNGSGFVGELTSAFFDSRDDKGLTLRADAPLASIGVDPNSANVTAEAAKALHTVIVDAHNEISNGVSRNKVALKLRRRILGKGTVTAYVGDNRRIGMYYKPSEIQSGVDWVLEPAKRYHIRLYNDDGREVLLDDMSEDVHDWISRRLRLSSGTSWYKNNREA